MTETEESKFGVEMSFETRIVGVCWRNSNWRHGRDSFARKLVVSILCLVFLMETTLAVASFQNTNLSYIFMNESIPDVSYHKLPRVGKCCRLGEMMIKEADGQSKCVPVSSVRIPPNSLDDEPSVFSPLFSDFNKTGLLAPGDRYNRFLAIIGDPCRFKKYMLSPAVSSDDEYYLLLNGSIYAPRQALMLSPGIDYCMELVPDLGVITLVCFPEASDVTSTDARITFYACGLLISVPFLVLTIVAYSITPSLMDIHGKALCHYCGCLAVAFATLAIAQLASGYLSDQMCVSIAFLIQFSFVACFFWLNVLCIETYIQVKNLLNRPTSVDEVDTVLPSIHQNNQTSRSSQRKANRIFFYYSLWAWIPPLILISISMIMDLNPTIPSTYVKPNFGAESCWFQSDEEAMPYFYVPVGLLVIGNIGLFILTAVTINRHQRNLDLRRLARNRDSDREDQRIFRRLKRVFLVCLGLFFIMGMNWSMELISWWARGDPLAWSAFDLINALQGLIVFAIFVMRKPIRTLVWYQIQKIRGNEPVDEPDVASLERTFLTVLNGDTFGPRIPAC